MHNNSKVLNDIISNQRPNDDKYGLGYNQRENRSSSKTTDQETQPRNYAETVRGDKKFYKKDHRDTPPPKIFRFQNQRQSETRRPQEEDEFRRVTNFRRSTTPKYQTIFLGLCYSCNNFGHKVVNCRANNMNRNNRESYAQNDYSRRPSETHNIYYNIFEFLSIEMECYKCNKFGHMAKDYRMKDPSR
jgi:hypothetical protein